MEVITIVKTHVVTKIEGKGDEKIPRYRVVRGEVKSPDEIDKNMRVEFNFLNMARSVVTTLIREQDKDIKVKFVEFDVEIPDPIRKPKDKTTEAATESK
jgi:hypothetical protein